MRHPIESIIAGKDNIDFLKEAPYFMSVREETNENGKVVWVIDYDQIHSPRFDPVVDECRGIVVCKETQKVICWPFRRFYNLGEDHNTEANFNWDKAFVQNKEDGSLIKVYHFDGKWRVGTRGTAFGNNTITNLIGEEGTITFRDLFLRALGLTEERFQAEMDYGFGTNANLFFELCTPENRVVTRYEKDTVFYLGTRVETWDYVFPAVNFSEEDMHLFPNWFKFLDQHDMSSFEEVIAAVSVLKDLKEGFVLVDDGGRRLKVKSPVYVIAHHTRGNGLNPKRAVDLILCGEVAEYIAYFPESTEYLQKYIDKWDYIKETSAYVFERFKNTESQKDFALAVKDYPFSSILFSMRKGKTFDEAFEFMTLNGKYRLFGID